MNYSFYLHCICWNHMNSGCSKVLKLKILMDTLGQKYTTRAQNKAFWLASFPVQKHSQNYYASKSLQVYAKWINMNWKLIHMISTNSRFHRVLWGFPPNRHDIAEVLLKVVLNTIPPTVWPKGKRDTKADIICELSPFKKKCFMLCHRTLRTLSYVTEYQVNYWKNIVNDKMWTLY
jgi:hypothetical protein